MCIICVINVNNVNLIILGVHSELTGLNHFHNVVKLLPLIHSIANMKSFLLNNNPPFLLFQYNPFYNKYLKEYSVDISNVETEPMTSLRYG